VSVLNDKTVDASTVDFSSGVGVSAQWSPPFNFAARLSGPLREQDRDPREDVPTHGTLFWSPCNEAKSEGHVPPDHGAKSEGGDNS
jgi:hypothetical protein